MSSSKAANRLHALSKHLEPGQKDEALEKSEWKVRIGILSMRVVQYPNDLGHRISFLRSIDANIRTAQRIPKIMAISVKRLRANFGYGNASMHLLMKRASSRLVLSLAEQNTTKMDQSRNLHPPTLSLEKQQ